MTDFQTRMSKAISYALRHRPDEYGLKLDDEGWVGIKDLLDSLWKKNRFAIGRKDIEEIIAASEKKRFEIHGDQIRATYGHSFKSKIEFTPVEPPKCLYHGTSQRAFKMIDSGEGIKPMSRQYVHLSSDFDTAVRVAKRHDSRPVILRIDTEQMAADGYKFYHSGNDGTWMCEHVPCKYICCISYCMNGTN